MMMMFLFNIQVAIIFSFLFLFPPIHPFTHIIKEKDEINETICKPVPEEKISILCPEEMKLIIREAYFSTSLESNPHCGENNYLHRTVASSSVHHDCYEDIRPSTIARCMTSRNCTFHQSEMVHQCSGSGHIMMKYSCINTSRALHHYCNSRLNQSYGYISSPTYPDYSAKLDECNWTIEATEGQTIELQVLDMQITNPRVVKQKTFLDPAVYECTDKLIVETDQKSEDLCGDEVTNLKTFQTKSSTVRLSFIQNEFRATRGWLVRYQVNGCPKLPDPFKGHIVEQNESSAVMSCCEGYIFKDTRESKKYLNCLRNNWDGIVSSCVKIADIDSPDVSPESSVASIDGDIDNNISMNYPSRHQLTKPIDRNEKALFSDFVIPISLMVLLVVVLVIFVVTIVKCRSRRSKASLLTYTHEATVPLTNTSPVNV